MDINVKDPRFLRWAGAILAIAVLVPLDFTSTMYSFTYAARKDAVAKLEVRHSELSRDLEKARLLVRNLARVEQEYQILHEQWKVAQTLLPEQNKMEELLRKVTAAGEQSGVTFDLFRPQAPIARGFYADNPVEISVSGGYHQTGVFLSRMANLNRIVNVGDLAMHGVAQQEDVPFTVETSFTLTAYTLAGGGTPRPTDTQKQPLSATQTASTAKAAASTGVSH